MKCFAVSYFLKNSLPYPSGRKVIKCMGFFRKSYIYIYIILIIIFFIIFSVHGNVIFVSMAWLTYH